jgi:DeoR family deoxyribose operon repressor
MNKRDQRFDKIIEYLKTRSAASIRDLSSLCGVSEITTRRDLAELAEDRIVTLLHGAAVLNQDSYYENFERIYRLADEGSKNREEKERIGERAGSMIAEDDIVIIDSGSTTEWLARKIPEERCCKALCYALNILIELHKKPNIDIVFAGGELHRNTLNFEGPEGINLIRRFRANTAFISAGGIDFELGVTSANSFETEAKRRILRSARTRVLLADASKIGTVNSHHFADIDDFEVLITDSRLKAEQREKIAGHGVEVIVV